MEKEIKKIPKELIGTTNCINISIIHVVNIGIAFGFLYANRIIDDKVFSKNVHINVNYLDGFYVDG